MVETTKFEDLHISEEHKADKAKPHINIDEFLAKFLPLASFEQAASFIAEWIKTDKKNKEQFPLTAIALLEKVLEYRNSIESQDALIRDSLLSQGVEGSEQGHILYFALNLVAFCQTNEKIPNFINRAILDALYEKVNKKEITEEQKELALNKSNKIKTEFIFDYVKFFKLKSVLDKNHFKQLAQTFLQKKNYYDAALIIHKFQMIEEFDCIQLIINLIDANKMPIAIKICQLNEDFKYQIISILTTPQNVKKAIAIIQAFNLNIGDFDAIKDLMIRQSLNYYLGRYLRTKKTDDDHLSLDRLEDLFIGFKVMLAYLVEELVKNHRMQEAKLILLRNNIGDTISEDILYKLEYVNVPQKLSIAPYDAFGPLSIGNYKYLPQHIYVEWISKDNDVDKLDQLFSERYIGIDTEWRPNLAKYHKTGMGLIQISGENVAFLIDIVSLRSSEKLDQKLSQIFADKNVVVVGFSFNSDMAQLSKGLPRMKFYKYIENYIDAQSYFSKIYKEKQMVGLAKVSEIVLGQQICKKEQMSNWERRPLRLSQQHYGALDAYILVEIIQEMSIIGEENGFYIQNFIKPLDNRKIKPLTQQEIDIEEEGYRFLDQRPQINKKPQQMIQDKYILQVKSSNQTQKIPTFAASAELSPEMKDKGFIVDGGLNIVGQMIRAQGYGCEIIKGQSFDYLCKLALDNDRVLITQNYKNFREDVHLPRGCLYYKANPDKQFQSLTEYFKF